MYGIVTEDEIKGCFFIPTIIFFEKNYVFIIKTMKCL